MEEFSRRILSWYRCNGRDLPWRATADPYKILVSEVMLQQTRVERTIPKYKEWLKRFPTFRSLAAAPRSDVLRCWSGLGYNNRAVRLHAVAKLVVERYGGVLPAEEKSLRTLPGIGPYTAGALMVFAHNHPGQCIDVNIERILKRVFFSRTSKTRTNTRTSSTTTTPTRIYIENFFLQSFPENRATDYCNALMDFGSAVCTATKPNCSACPVYALCASKGERPDEQKLREKRRQPPFLHSNRWWRGQIMKVVNGEGAIAERALLARILSSERRGTRQQNTAGERKKSVPCRRVEVAFHRALRQLQDEGLLSRGRHVTIKN